MILCQYVRILLAISNCPYHDQMLPPFNFHRCQKSSVQVWECALVSVVCTESLEHLSISLWTNMYMCIFLPTQYLAVILTVVIFAIVSSWSVPSNQLALADNRSIVYWHNQVLTYLHHNTGPLVVHCHGD
jgi:hypothetical protein